MIVDTSALIAAYAEIEPRHVEVRNALEHHDGQLIVSPYVVAEADCLLAERHGVRMELEVLRDLCAGGWELAAFGRADLSVAADVVEKYADQRIGVADASLVVLAKRYGTRTVATLDRRHFEVLRPLDGGHFTIVP